MSMTGRGESGGEVGSDMALRAGSGPARQCKSAASAAQFNAKGFGGNCVRGGSARAGSQLRQRFGRFFSGRAQPGRSRGLQARPGMRSLFIDESRGFFDHGEMKGRRERSLIKAPAF
jgi:hypothetical protein